MADFDTPSCSAASVKLLEFAAVTKWTMLLKDSVEITAVIVGAWLKISGLLYRKVEKQNSAHEGAIRQGRDWRDVERIKAEW